MYHVIASDGSHYVEPNLDRAMQKTLELDRELEDAGQELDCDVTIGQCHCP